MHIAIGQEVSMSSFHAQALTSIVAKGKGEWDNAAIVSFYNEMMGVSEDD